MTPRIVARHRAGAVHVYDLTGPVAAEPRPTWSHPVDEVQDCAATPDRAVYATADAVVCADRSGTELWRHALGAVPPGGYHTRTTCVFSADASTVWVCRPLGVDGDDRWLVLDAGSGAALAEVGLGTAGHSGVQYAHPGGDVLVDVGEGQDGSLIFRGRLVEGAVALHAYPWVDRILIDVAPDGRTFLTVDHGQEDVALHGYPDGEVLWRLDVAAFGEDADEVFVEWNGGYLTAGEAVATLVGEDEEEQELLRHHLVDVATGRPLGPFGSSADGPYDLTPLGDGSWLTTGDDGLIRRHHR